MHYIYRLSLAGILSLSGVIMMGCAVDRHSSYFADDAIATKVLGPTAVAIQVTGDQLSKSIDPKQIHSVITDAIASVPGTKEVALPVAAGDDNLSDYELLLAARQAGAKSLCIVTINSLGSAITIGMGLEAPLFYEGKSFASFNVRLLDVATGKLLIDSKRDSSTHAFYEPAQHALVDLKRGMLAALRQRSVVSPEPKAPASRPATVVTVTQASSIRGG